MPTARRRPRPHKISKMNEKSLSDRILGWSLTASVVINLAWIALVSHSDIFGAAASFTQLHEKKIKVFKPIPQKPKPKEVKPPPPPPRQKPPPKIKPLKQIKPLPPRPTPRPTPPVPTHTIKVASSKRTTSTLTTPVVPENTGPIAPVVPTYTPTVQAPPVQAPPVQAPPVQAPPVQTPPVQAPPVKVIPVQAPPVHVDPPPPTKTKYGYDPNFNRSEAELIGDVPAPDVSGLTTEPSNNCVISYTVDEEGHITRVRIKQTSGSPDFDDRCKAICEHLRYKPAVQDGIPHSFPVLQTFTYG
jgi:TonB family protein